MFDLLSRRRLLSLWCAVVFSIPAVAQTQQPSAAEIRLKLKKLNFLGSVLYVAAHPDDENTRVITYFANERLAATRYLSLTRGDGGQNLIGSELGEKLGVIRTQELLAARRIDGGSQRFSRAVDFGFSKTADETLAIWDKEKILSDVVRAYRSFQPDVIMTRFPPDQRAGHGHHTASAMLAIEAFDISNDASTFPDQAKTLGTWQPKRIYINTGRFFSADINEKTPGVTTVDVGGYNPLLGRSYAEIAAASRSQHKSQGFGSQGRRGETPEFFELVKGAPATSDVFDGVNTTWSRLSGGKHIQALVERVLKTFDADKPSASVPQLLQIRKEIQKLSPSVWRARKLDEVNALIRDCLGLYVEVTASHYQTVPGERVRLSFELVNRSDVQLSVQQIASDLVAMDTTLALSLPNNKLITFQSEKVLTSAAAYSDPYWLRQPHSSGTYEVPKEDLIGLPESPPAISFVFSLRVGSEPLLLQVPVIYKWTDPVQGELTRPVEIVPPVLVNLVEEVVVFPDHRARQITVRLQSASSNKISGSLQLELPAGWVANPAEVPFTMAKRNEQVIVKCAVTPAVDEGTFELKAHALINGQRFSQAITVIDYSHIPTQTLLKPAVAKLVHIDLETRGQLIGYINGAGDDVPAALRNMGYEVWEMKDDEVTPANLARLDAVVLGIRAMNTNERIKYFLKDLFDYVKQGGTLVSQYNTSGGLLVDRNEISPLPLQLSRDRVTEEESEVKILRPEHPVLNTPNKITAKDFEHWQQERGLYFPNQWDAAFEPLLSMHDTGEDAKDGSLLVARYGKGYYIYTGLSFFRQLPQGVPGAYRLFANLVSIGSKPTTQPHAKENHDKP